MPAYAAMLRGVNVGGNRPIRMEELRASMEGLGFKDVVTYVQSGNVVFKTSAGTNEALARETEARLQSDFKVPISVLVRSGKDLTRTIEKNPFAGEKGATGSRLLVGFLSQKPAKEGLKMLESYASKTERFECIGTELYLFLPDGAGKSKLAARLTEKVLGAVITTRNWNTVLKLDELARERA